MIRLPAVSLHQPWASFVAIQVKPYETRHWPPPPDIVGQRIAIHATLKPVSSEHYAWWYRVSRGTRTLPLGSVVCSAMLTAVHFATDVLDDPYGDYSRGRYAWELRDVEVYDPPIPAVGHQGIWLWHHESGPIERYRPANGTESDFFQEQWCARCSRNREKNPCKILGRSYAFSIDDPDYPTEWIKDAGDYPGYPRCTAFRARAASRRSGRRVPGQTELF